MSNESVSESALLIVGSTNVFNFSKPIITIGRRENNDLIIDDLSVSRAHAELRFSNGKYEIFDLNSTGGTFVNGIRVERKVLNKGDVITLANIHLVFGQGEFQVAEETTEYVAPKLPPQEKLHTRTLSPNTIPLDDFEDDQ